MLCGAPFTALPSQDAICESNATTAAETLRTIAADPKHLGAEIGFFAVLHTWGQNLLHHPHLHCVVPGGGLSMDEIARTLDISAVTVRRDLRLAEAWLHREFIDAWQIAYDQLDIRGQPFYRGAEP